MINIGSYLDGIQHKDDGEEVIDDIIGAAEKLCCKTVFNPDGIVDIEPEKTIIKTNLRGNVIRKAIERLLSKFANYEPNKKIVIMTEEEYEDVRVDYDVLYLIRRDDSCFAVELDDELNFNLNGNCVRLPSISPETWWEFLPSFLTNRSYMGNSKHVEVFAGKYYGDITSIDSESFHDILNLTRVTIDFQHYAIHERAFLNCRDLRKINLGSGVTSIHQTAFDGCSNLNTIVINKPSGSISGAPWGADNADVIWTG